MILNRLKQYIDYKGISISAFEKSIGMSNAAFRNALKNNSTIGCDKLERILHKYPDLNIKWLFDGEGDMFVATDRKAQLTILDRLSIFMNAKDLNNNKITIQCGLSNGLLGNAFKSGNGLNSDTIEKLLRSYPDLSADWLLTGKGSMLIVPRIEEIGFNSTSETENVIKLLLQELSEKSEEIGRLKEQIYILKKKEGQP